MKIDQYLLDKVLEEAFEKGYVEIKDHRNNTIVLKNGIFVFNDCVQPKSNSSIKTIFLEAFKLTRFIQLDNKKYVREGSKWIEK